MALENRIVVLECAVANLVNKLNEIENSIKDVADDHSELSRVIKSAFFQLSDSLSKNNREGNKENNGLVLPLSSLASKNTEQNN